MVVKWRSNMREDISESRSLCVGQMQMRQSDFRGMQQSTWANRMDEATKDVDNFAIQK